MRVAVQAARLLLGLTAVLSVLSVLSCRKPAPLTLPSRPPGAGSGEPAARVRLRGGTGAHVKAETGLEFPALAGTVLLRSDLLVVPSGEFLVVLIVGNGYLVRIDEDLTLRVGELVLLDAPATGESLASQLNRLVSKDELGRAERLAGTQSRVAAAEAIAPEELPD